MFSNPLTDVLPPKARKYFYALLFVAAVGFGAYKMTEGDWLEFAAAVVVALGGGTAASNVNAD